MKLPPLPCWVAVLPGLSIGWLVATATTSSHFSKGEVDAGHREPLNSDIHFRELSNSPPSPARSPGLRLASPKLAVLRGARRILKLDFESFSEADPRKSDSVWEVMRDVLDLAPVEEEELQGGYAREAEALRRYERSNLSHFTVAPGKIAFRVPGFGPFHRQMAARIDAMEQEILGPERAEMFRAITQTKDFCNLGVGFTGEVEFTSEPISEGQLIQLRLSRQTLIAQIGAASPTMEIFDRFSHVLDEESKRRFLTPVSTE